MNHLISLDLASKDISISDDTLIINHTHQNGDQLQISLEVDVRHFLRASNRIASIWHVDDVLGECPHLRQDQALEVLAHLNDYHDAEIGINWTTIQVVADQLYPQ